MATKKKNSTASPRRLRSALQRTRTKNARGHVASPDELERATFALCEEEFERIWGEPWHPRAGVADSGTAALFIRSAEAASAKKKDADRAIQLYDATRAKLNRIAAPLREFFAGKPAASPAANQLGALLGLIETQFPAASTLAQGQQKRFALSDAQLARRDDRSAFVARYAFQVHPEGPPVDPADPHSQSRQMTNREIAIVWILCCVGGAKRGANIVTANDAIRDEEKRIGAILSDQKGT